MFRQIGPTEIMIIVAVAMLLFGGRKLPEMARGSGRALRIFKAEIKGMHDDDEDSGTDSESDSDLYRQSESVDSAKDRKPDEG